MKHGLKVVAAIAALVVLFSVLGCGSSTSGGSSAKVTRQDVVNFVNEAVAYGKQNGQAKATADFNNQKGKFVRGELYIYAYNWNGIALANGGNPSLTGQNLIDMTDPNGVKVIQQLIKQARAGGGWVSYMWPYPETKINEPKLGYSKAVDGKWWLGSGIYTKTP